MWLCHKGVQYVSVTKVGQQTLGVDQTAQVPCGVVVDGVLKLGHGCHRCGAVRVQRLLQRGFGAASGGQRGRWRVEHSVPEHDAVSGR